MQVRSAFDVNRNARDFAARFETAELLETCRGMHNVVEPAASKRRAPLLRLGTRMTRETPGQVDSGTSPLSRIIEAASTERRWFASADARAGADASA